ncbi:MAG TPA: hypothetical protein VL201_00125, partial [Patescibacteria group bacterium]|nr:hypothetical protein [Patescibacteria group bacterium]
FFLNDSNDSIVIQRDFGLISGTIATEAFIKSLNQEYDVTNYFKFFENNSIRNLYKIYTWYHYIGYAEIMDIICAVIVVKACKFGTIKPKLYAEFTECLQCVKKNQYKQNWLPSDNYQKEHHKQLAKKISDAISEDIKNSSIPSSLIINFSQNICKILNICNTFQCNTVILQNFLCECQKINNKKIENQDEIDFELLSQHNNEPKVDEELKTLVSQDLTKYNNVETILCFTNMKFDSTKHIAIQDLLGAFNDNVNTIVFNNVNFSNDYNPNIPFLLNIRNPFHNRAKSVKVYLTGKETILTGNQKRTDQEWTDLNLSLLLLRAVYDKRNSVNGVHPYDNSPLIPGTLFVDSETISDNLQKRLDCNLIYYTKPYLGYSELKKSLKNISSLTFITNRFTSLVGNTLMLVPFGSVIDIVFSFFYNAAIAHAYGFDHFLVPISLLLVTAISFSHSLNGMSIAEDDNGPLAKQTMIATNICFLCIILIATFYIYKEVKNKPSGWHTYSFFPWITLLCGIICLYPEKINKFDYEGISHGKVEFVKNSAAFLT